MSRLPPMLAAVAALAGAAGVALAAAGAHLPQGGEFTRTAAVFLILHAAVGIGLASHARIAYHPGALALFGFMMLAGAALFAADLAYHDFFNTRLFPFAAPIGGTTMILAWFAVAIAFAVEAGRRR
jgi:uncharacterized membrane protein YgdD (TMEM256/DUF423 family)